MNSDETEKLVREGEELRKRVAHLERLLDDRERSLSIVKGQRDALEKENLELLSRR